MSGRERRSYDYNKWYFLHNGSIIHLILDLSETSLRNNGDSTNTCAGRVREGSTGQTTPSTVLLTLSPDLPTYDNNGPHLLLF